MTIELKKVSFRAGAETHIYETDLALEAGEFNILLGTTLSGADAPNRGPFAAV